MIRPRGSGKKFTWRGRTGIPVCVRNVPSRNQAKLTNKLVNVNIVKALCTSTNKEPTLGR